MVDLSEDELQLDTWLQMAIKQPREPDVFRERLRHAGHGDMFAVSDRLDINSPWRRTIATRYRHGNGNYWILTNSDLKLRDEPQNGTVEGRTRDAVSATETKWGEYYNSHVNALCEDVRDGAQVPGTQRMHAASGARRECLRSLFRAHSPLAPPLLCLQVPIRRPHAVVQA